MQERLRRDQSDFLNPKSHEGEVLDFHALRHTCGAWLAMAGEHPKVIQSVMRHSVITLTMDTYGHLFPGQEADAVGKMRGIMGPALETLRATGTDDAAAKSPARVPRGESQCAIQGIAKRSRATRKIRRCARPVFATSWRARLCAKPCQAMRCKTKLRPAGIEPATCGLEVV